jgi:sterol O-acyltransferase
MHSYMTTNADLEAYRRAVKTLKETAREEAKNETPVSPATQNGQFATPSRLTRRASRVAVNDPQSVELVDNDTLIKDMEMELTKGTMTYPNNVTFANFIDFLLIPTLVYELDYPRTEKYHSLRFNRSDDV